MRVLIILITILNLFPMALNAETLQLPHILTDAVSHQWHEVTLHQEGPFVSLSATLRLAKTFRAHGASSRHDAEAILQISLPSRQHLRQYALDVGGVMRPAEIVERIHTRSTFEHVFSRGVDPGLLRPRLANHYRLHVYSVLPDHPAILRLDITALASREACGWKISLSEELLDNLGDGAFTLHSQVVPQVDGFEARRSSQDGATWQLSTQRDHTGKTSVCLPAQQDLQLWSVSHGNTVMRFLEVIKDKDLTVGRQPLFPSHVQLIWDNSFSQRHRLLDKELALLRSYLAGQDVNLTVTVLDVVANSQRNFKIAGGNLAQLERYLRGLVPDGASALDQWSPEATADVVLVFSDGVSTWPASGKLNTSQVRPVHVISSVPNVDHAQIAMWSRQGGVWIDLLHTLPESAAKQLSYFGQGIRIPNQLSTDSLSGWFGNAQATHEPVFRACAVGKKPAQLDLHSATKNNQLREALQSSAAVSGSIAAAVAYWCSRWAIDHVQTTKPYEKQTLVDLSKRFGVTSAETSMLVFKQDTDYIRRGIMPSWATEELKSKIKQAELERQNTRMLEQQTHEQILLADLVKRQAWLTRRFSEAGVFTERTTTEIAPLLDGPFWSRWSLKDERDARIKILEQRRLKELQQTDRTTFHSLKQMDLIDDQERIALTDVADFNPIGVVDQQGYKHAEVIGSMTNAQDVLAHYYAIREKHLSDPAFFYEVALALYAFDEKEAAERVLSTVIELFPKEIATSRMVVDVIRAHHSISPRAKDLLEALTSWEFNDPNNARAMGLFDADAGRCDDAAQRLAQIVMTPYDKSSAGINQIALDDINQLSKSCALNTPWPLPKALQVDLIPEIRLVLTWNVQGADMDLHVLDPNGEEVFFDNPTSEQGGLLTTDSRYGSGPEAFVLDSPKKGAYQVYVNYYGNHASYLPDAVYVSLEINQSTQKNQIKTNRVTKKIVEQRKKILITEFEVK
jgi:Ca-activated chloride channel homolog